MLPLILCTGLLVLLWRNAQAGPASRFVGRSERRMDPVGRFVLVFLAVSSVLGIAVRVLLLGLIDASAEEPIMVEFLGFEVDLSLLVVVLFYGVSLGAAFWDFRRNRRRVSRPE